MTITARTEDSPVYSPSQANRLEDDATIKRALAILAERLRLGDAIAAPADARNYCQLRLGPLEHEVFSVVFLDAQHRVIAFEELFRGTLTQTSVYPREIVKRALALNAAAVLLTHNHPSGSTDPSRADELLTVMVKQALSLVDVRVLDHIVVSAHGNTSFADRGLI